MEIRVFNNEEEFMRSSLDFFLVQYKNWETDQSKPYKFFRMALSGGTTPGPFYSALADQQLPNGILDFSKIELIQVDERYVKRDDPESNARLINESLLKKLTVPPKEFHAVKTNLPVEEAVITYENRLFDLADHPLDFTVLGMGADGHIASLFPGAAPLKEKKHFVAHAVNGNSSKARDRITLTLPPILKSHSILVLVKGRDKEAVVEELRSGEKTVNEFPARALAEHGNTVIHVLLPK